MVEVEDLTESHVQTHIGRICILTKLHQFIDDVMEFVGEGESFSVRVLEDLAEIIDFGPHYDEDDGKSHSSSDQEEIIPVEGDARFDDDSFDKDSSPEASGNWRMAVWRHSDLLLRGVEIVAELNDLLDSHSVEDGESHTYSKVVPPSESAPAVIPIPKVVQTGLTLRDVLVDQLKTVNGPMVANKDNLWKGSGVGVRDQTTQ